jgi:hypothetical protein
VGLDNKLGLLDVGEGLFNESDGREVGGKVFSKVDQGGLPILVGDGRVGTGLEEEADSPGDCIFRAIAHASTVKSCVAVIVVC